MRIGHLIIYSAIVGLTGAVNFTQCLQDVRNGDFGLQGALDNHGNPVSDTRDATAISYNLCLSACGRGSSTFSWSILSQRTASWLFPWLALVSQLPYGSDDNLDNLQSVLLCVGSPALAAYSLALTTLNRRWITRRFLPMYQYYHTHTIVHTLSTLQQAPLLVTNRVHLPLLFRAENQRWWQEVKIWMSLTNSWSVSTVASIGWVVVAFVFTVLDAFTDEVKTGNNGLAVGALWLWLLPIVVGWLLISPECNSRHLECAIDSANKRVFASTEPRQESQYDRVIGPISLLRPTALRRDETRSPPIFNYSRVFVWSQVVETVAESLETATKGMHQEQPGSFGGASEPLYNQEGVCWRLHAWERMFVAGCLAMWLQWGTTAGAVVSIWFSPTIGLGCRSTAYLAYGGSSTLSWLLITLSGILAYYASSASQRSLGWRGVIMNHLGIFLRRLGKIIASLNAVGLIAICIFHFSSLFANCYCDSSVIWWGTERAYDVIELRNDDIDGMRRAWFVGEVLAGGSAFGFLLFVNLFSNFSFPDPQTGY